MLGWGGLMLSDSIVILTFESTYTHAHAHTHGYEILENRTRIH